MEELLVCPATKMHVIYNGVVTPTDVERGRENHNQKPLRTVLFPNRFFSYKNPLLFIDACAEVFRAVDNVRVQFAGSGELLGAMKQRCRDVGIMHRCTFLGSLLPEDIPYSEADLVVNCPSSREGMSNVLMEALAQGTPVIATKVGGSPELLRNVPFGRLVPIDDKRALVEAMRDLLLLTDAERVVLGKQARAYMSEKFSAQLCVDRHESFYGKILSDRSSDF